MRLAFAQGLDSDNSEDSSSGSEELHSAPATTSAQLVDCREGSNWPASPDAPSDLPDQEADYSAEEDEGGTDITAEIIRFNDTACGICDDGGELCVLCSRSSVHKQEPIWSLLQALLFSL